MTLETLRPLVKRLRNAENALDRLQRLLATAKTEHIAARQELDDAIIAEFTERR